jgi:DNA-binding transcriptional LysR family regulator
MMYNPQLETFIRAADAGSFSKAAAESYITPTAVIKQINLLEASLGVKLFIRTHRGLFMTPAGKSLYQDARYIIQYSHDSVIRARNAMQENAAVIRIGTSPMTPAQLLLSLWPQIQQYCPHIKFQLVPFDNTPFNAKEILANLGQHIDVVGGIFDETMLRMRHCAGLEISREPLCCAVSVQHPLAAKDILDVRDLYGQDFMLMKRNWSRCIDALRDDISEHHPQINVVNFDFYDMNVFNRCENSENVLMAIKGWADVHPLLKVIPVRWEHAIPYGVLYNPNPSPVVADFLAAVQKVIGQQI